MGNNKKNKIIILSVILLSIIVIGSLLVKNNTKDKSDKNNFNSKNTFEEANKDFEIGKDIDFNNFHYVEKFLGEEDWAMSETFLRYSDKIVKIMGSEKFYLEDLENEKELYEFPNEDMTTANAWWIQDDIFWTVKYYKEIEKVKVRSFDQTGNMIDDIILQNFEGEIFDNSYIMVNEMQISDDYIYILSRTTSQPILQVFTKSGELKITYEGVSSFDVDEKGRFIYTRFSSREFPDSGFFMTDLTNGDEVFRNASYRPSPIRFSKDKKFIYGFDEKVLVFEADSGKFIKSVFEFGKDSTYFLDDYDIKDLMIGENGELYFSLRMKLKNEEDFETIGVKNYYYLYTKQEGERPKRETTLTLTAPYRYDFIEEAIKRYELKYPNEHVEYQYTYNSREIFIKSSEEYGAKLTLDIINGDIGDIVQIGGSGLNYENLLRTDAFMDLTGLIMKDKSYSDLNKSVLNGIKINNTIRTLPINYVFSQYELNEDLEKQLGINLDFNKISWSQILDIVKIIENKAPDRHLFTTYMNGSSPWETFGTSLLNANMQDLINLESKTFDLNQEWFKDLLIKFKESSKSKNFVLANAEYDLMDNLHGSLLASSWDYNYYYGDKVNYFNEYNKENKSRLIPDFRGEKNSNRIGYSMRMYSINERSKRKEEAWKFLSFLLEEDIQYIASREKTGMPINEKGVEKMISEFIFMNRRFTEDNIDRYNMDRYNKNMIENSHEIDHLYDMSGLKLDLFDPIKAFMDDQITVDEALKKAEENLIIRLNE